MEPIALAASVRPRMFQLFLSDAKWGHEAMQDRLQQLVARDHADPMAVGLIDETLYPKKEEFPPA